MNRRIMALLGQLRWNHVLFIGWWLLSMCWMYVMMNDRITSLEHQLNSMSPFGSFAQSVSSPAQWSADNLLVIYNRIPKTGSTTFMDGVVYKLAKRNGFSAIHLNVTRNKHTLHIADQAWFVQNATNWSERKPALFHGHLAYLDFSRFGAPNPIYLQIVREPMDRFVTYYYFLRCGDTFRPHLQRSRMGDNQTFDECVAKNGRDCAPEKMWLQIPFFCGHAAECWRPGSRWALEQAKRNLVQHYFLVGTTEYLSQFVAVLEHTLPSMFDGAVQQLNSGDPHIRRTKCKQQPSPTTTAMIQDSPVYQMESQFYQFAAAQFEATLSRLYSEDWNRPFAQVQLQYDQDGLPIRLPRELRYKKIKPKTPPTRTVGDFMIQHDNPDNDPDN